MKMNKSVQYFNTLVGEMLNHCFREVLFPGVWQFLDSKGLLSLNLVRDNDEIHLNSKGLAMFVRKVKLWIFEREVIERRARESKNMKHLQHRRVGSQRPPS